jgi:hypothetical protein
VDLGILRVTTPDGQVREYPLDVGSVFIGRAEGNRVVIDHVSVSRRHARLDFADGQARLEDLSSATGTYVNGQRLNPGTVQAISPGQAVRFGDCQAVLVSAPGAGPGGPPVTGDGGRAVAGRPEQAIAIWITAPTAPIAPGSAASASVTIQNRSDVVDTVSLAIHGVPAGWVRVTRPSLQLLPDAREEIIVVIQPPRDTSAWAGEYEVAAAATSAVHGVEVRSLAKLTVLPFGGLALSLRPPRSNRGFTAEVANESNSPVVVELRAQEGDVVAQFQPAELTLDPGERATSRVTAGLARSHFFGAEERKPFAIDAVGAGRTMTAGAELIYRPPWLIWRWVLVALLLIGIGLGAWFAYSAFAGGDDDPPVGPDGETPTVTTTAGTETATTEPTTSVTAGPTTPTAEGLAPGSTAVVINSPDNSCLLVRRNHTRVETDPGSERVARLCNGALVTITGERVEAEGYYWYPVRTAEGVEGWSAEGLISGGERYLEPAP